MPEGNAIDAGRAIQDRMFLCIHRSGCCAGNAQRRSLALHEEKQMIGILWFVFPMMFFGVVTGFWQDSMGVSRPAINDDVEDVDPALE